MERNIRGAFKGARLIPLDLETIVLKLNVQLQTLTLVEEKANYPTLWVLKTLKTVLKARSQSEYLKR